MEELSGKILRHKCEHDDAYYLFDKDRTYIRKRGVFVPLILYIGGIYMERRIAAIIAVEDTIAFDEIDDGPVTYLEEKLGELEENVISLENCFLMDKDEEKGFPWYGYINYLIDWAFIHHGDEDEGKIPYLHRPQNTVENTNYMDYIRDGGEIGVQLFCYGGGPAFYISREIEKIIGNVIMNSSNWDVFRNIIFTKNYPDILVGADYRITLGGCSVYYDSTDENEEKANALCNIIFSLIEDEKKIPQIVREEGDRIKWILQREK